MAYKLKPLNRDALKEKALQVKNREIEPGALESVDYLLGTIIKSLREDHLGISQKKFAELIEFKQPQLSLIEKGEYPLRMNQFMQICELAGVNAMALWAQFLDSFKICPSMPTMDFSKYTQFAENAEDDIYKARLTIMEKDSKRRHHRKKINQEQLSNNRLTPA